MFLLGAEILIQHGSTIQFPAVVGITCRLGCVGGFPGRRLHGGGGRLGRGGGRRDLNRFGAKGPVLFQLDRNGQIKAFLYIVRDLVIFHPNG